jgi:hypothetical protein
VFSSLKINFFFLFFSSRILVSLMDSMNDKNQNKSILIDSENEETELFDDEDEEEEEEIEEEGEEENNELNEEYLERYIIMNNFNSLSMNNIVNIEDGLMWNLL